MDPGDNLGSIGIDVVNGGVDVGVGDGLAIDTKTGGLDLQIAPGIDIPL